MAVARHVATHGILTAPLAVGRMAVHAEELQESTKGKAVHILHTFGDNLWDMGCKSEPPESFDTALVSGLVDEAGVASGSARGERDNNEELSNIAEAKPPPEDLPSETSPQGWHSPGVAHFLTE